MKIQNIIRNHKLEKFTINELLIKTNDCYLYADLKLYFEPYFRVSQEPKSSKVCQEELIALVIEDEVFNNLIKEVNYKEVVNMLYGGRGKNGDHFYLSSYKCNIEGYTALFFDYLSAFYLTDEKGKFYVLVKSTQILYRFVRRLVRSEFLYRDWIKNHFIPLHGACVVKGNTAVAFIGDSGSGKTSAMLPLIEYLGYDYVASDLIFLEKNGTGVLGSPEKMRITQTTLQQYSPKYDYLIKTNKYEKLALSPLHFSIAYHCKIFPMATLKTIILPEINIASGVNSMKKINSSLVLKKYLSPFFNNHNQFENVLWTGEVYQLHYTGDVNQLVEIYKNCEVFI